MSDTIPLVVFRLDEERYALPLSAVERVVRAVAVTRLPNAPPVVLGVIDVDGRILPVLDVRRRFRLPEREISSDDHFLMARTDRRAVALVVDDAEGVIEPPESAVIVSAGIAPGLEQFPGVVKLENGLVLIYDLERFLSVDEGRALDEAMSREANRGA